VSYWTTNLSPFTIAGTTTGYPIKGQTINGWTYYSHLVSGQSTISVSGNGVLDELRLYPSNAQMTTYTYSPLTGMSSSTDAKGEITYYEYDNFQRLMNIKDKDGNIIKHIDYHYQQ
jgi:YD repeat-containing protein